jgi:hypothetical protein
MADVIFDTYLDHLVRGLDWTTFDIRAAMFDKLTWAPAKGDLFMAGPIAAGAVECAAVGYTRQALVSQVANLDGAGHRELLHTAVADFGSLAAGTAFDTLVTFVQVTNDADSWLVAAFDVGAQTTDGTDQRFVPDTDGLFQLLMP